MWHQIVLWFQTEYLPAHQAFYFGQVYGNLFVVPIAFVLGWLWSKTKFWPLRPIEHGINKVHQVVTEVHGHVTAIHEKHDDLRLQIAQLHQSHNEIHRKLDALQK